MSAPTEPPPRTGGLSLARVGRSAAILGSAALVGQLLALVRELFLAANVGISGEFDALIISAALPVQLAYVLRGGVMRALVPAYLDTRLTHGRAGARLVAGVIVTWVGLGGIALWVLLAVFATQAIAVAGPGLSVDARASAVTYLQLLAPVAFLSAVTGVLMAVLQAEERFRGIAAGTVIEPAVIVATMVLLWDERGLDSIAIGTLVGAMASLLVVLVAVFRASIVPRVRLWQRGLGLGLFARHAFPITVSLGLLQVNPVVDSAIATLLGPGAVSALRYAGTLFRAPISAINAAWGTAIYPAIVTASHEKEGLATASALTLRYVIAIFTPIAVLVAMVAPVAVSTLYDRGGFTPDDLVLTAQVLAAFAPLVLLLMVQPIFVSANNARRRGMVLLAASLVDIVSHVALGIVFGRTIGVAGIAMATSAATFLTVVFFSWRLRILEPGYAAAPHVRGFLVALLASLPAAMVVGALSWSGVFAPGLVGGLLALAAYGTLGVAGYLVLSWRLGVPEVHELAGIMRVRIARRRASRDATR